MFRCPNCGGIPSHLLTDIDGKAYYRCATGLTTLKKEKDGIPQVSEIVPCDTILDAMGREVDSTIAYITGGKIQTLSVTMGKERR